MNESQHQIRDWSPSKFLNTRRGPIEYIESGPAVLALHGAMGGYDQGQIIVRTIGVSGYRYVSISRPRIPRHPSLSRKHAREGIPHLPKEISARGLKNIKAMVADVSPKTPLGDKQVDLCLMATVLHDLVQIKAHEGVLKEVQRVLNPKGILAIIEFKKIEGPPGPPLRIRLNPREVDRMLYAHGFKKK